MFLSPKKVMSREQYELFLRCFQAFKTGIHRLVHTIAANNDNNPLGISEEDFGCPVSRHNTQHVFHGNVEYPTGQLLPVVMLVNRILIPFRTKSWCYEDGRSPSSCRFCNGEGFASAFSEKYFSLVMDPEEGKFQFEPHPYQCLLPCPYCEAGRKIDSIWKLNDSGVYDKSRQPVPTVLDMLQSDAGRMDYGELKEAA